MPRINPLAMILGAVLGAIAYALIAPANTSQDEESFGPEQQAHLDDLATRVEKLEASNEGEEFESRVEATIDTIVQRRQQEQRRAQEDARKPREATTDFASSDHGAIYGQEDADITLFVFADYRCGFCNRYNPEVKALVDESDGAVNLIKVNYPVLGATSRELANAAECVQRTESAKTFYAFSDALYESQAWEQAARATGINRDELATCVQEREYEDLIERNLSEGNQLGMTGTPATLAVRNNDGTAFVLSGFMPRQQLQQRLSEVMRNGAN